MIDEKNETRTKEDFIKELVRSLISIDNEIAPYREQRKELVKEYKENGWLSKADIKTVQSVMGMVKKGLDIDEVLKTFEIVEEECK